MEASLNELTPACPSLSSSFWNLPERCPHKRMAPERQMSLRFAVLVGSRGHTCVEQEQAHPPT